MSKFSPQISFRGIDLDRQATMPLHRQLYEFLRGQILGGEFKPGQRLPATRVLAKQLGVSRNTIMHAYKQLITEGYLESSIGADTRVTHTLPEMMLQVDGKRRKNRMDASAEIEIAPAPKLSERGRILTQLPYPYWDRTGSRPFSSSLPGVDLFPNKLWEKLLVSGWRSLTAEQLSYPSALGYRPLREAIATYLRGARGVRCTADQVVITNGAQQALSTTASLLLNKGDKVWIENPSYNGVKIALSQTQVQIVPIPVDENGLIFSEGKRLAPGARMAFVTPSHQYPLGVTMSLTRRLELLGWAQANKAWIVEDDYDSEYRYAGHPLEALQGLDETGRVIYIGTFSKVLFPALRLGYMVVPTNLVEPLRLARAYADRGASLLEQVALTDFIRQGHMERHVRRMRTLYAERQAFLVEMAHKFLEGLISIEVSDAGLHVVGWLPDDLDDRQVSQRLAEGGIYAPPLSYFALTPLARGGLVMGYAAVPPDEMVTA